MPRREFRGTAAHRRAERPVVTSGASRTRLQRYECSRNGFQDGLGERRQTTGAEIKLLDLVIVHESLGGVAGFEAALRQRRESSHRSSTRRSAPQGRRSSLQAPSRIVVATDHVSGVRLSDLLAIAERRLIPLEYDGAIGLIRQLLDAAAALRNRCRRRATVPSPPSV